MGTDQEKQTTALYVSLMDEVKLRLAAIEAGTSGKLPLMPDLVRELCFLQIRMICELIALACLVAHGDLVQSRDLRKEWAADEIMRQLSSLHPDFYPIPARAEVQGTNVHFEELKTNPLPKAELIGLYGRCGDVLHKGSIKKLLSDKAPAKMEFPEIAALAAKFNNLLSAHVVVTRGEEKLIACILRSSVGGRTEAVLTRRSNG